MTHYIQIVLLFALISHHELREAVYSYWFYFEGVNRKLFPASLRMRVDGREEGRVGGNSGEGERQRRATEGDGRWGEAVDGGQELVWWGTCRDPQRRGQAPSGRPPRPPPRASTCSSDWHSAISACLPSPPLPSPWDYYRTPGGFVTKEPVGSSPLGECAWKPPVLFFCRCCHFSRGQLMVLRRFGGGEETQLGDVHGALLMWMKPHPQTAFKCPCWWHTHEWTLAYFLSLLALISTLERASLKGPLL